MIKIVTLSDTFWFTEGRHYFKPGTFTTYKPFPSFCVYAHVVITHAARFAADPIAVFDSPFVIIIQGRKPRSLLSYHWFHTVVSLTNLPLTLFGTIYFLKIIFRNIYLTSNCVISFLWFKRKIHLNQNIIFTRYNQIN